ncbi:MAG: hypothetical protein A2176_06135 [Spirochaetes bacterium RBG_13_51_14]|nr:MAG: hypothetical protein A2176_06135 [Spirochaetes bacterium RBG_13_51_14]
MKIKFSSIETLFDLLERRWGSSATRRSIGFFLVLTYIVSLVLIELNRQKLLPGFFSDIIPMNHLYSIDIAFTLLLLIEVIDLIFGLARSVSSAVGKQFEIFSLILLRQSFKEFSHFHEPLQWNEVSASAFPIISGALGALFIFFGLVYYYRCIQHQPITENSMEQRNFITAKKFVSLILLCIFIYMVLLNGYLHLGNEKSFDIFKTFYTVLIFSDILIVLISSRYSHTYSIVFRNTGFTLATVLIRIALTAPHYYNAVLGSGVMLYVLILMIAYNKYIKDIHHGDS